MKKDSKMPYYYDDDGGSRIGQFWRSIPAVTRNIIMVNVIMFIATLVNEDFMVGCFSLFYPASPHFRWWQCITHMFMHGGFWHIFFNMYTLAIFGPVLENQWGSKKFLLFYFVVGLGAALCHNLVMHLQITHAASAGNMALAQSLMRVPTIGASGAIYGVLLGFAMLFPNAELRLLFLPFFPLKAKWLILVFAAIELLTGVMGTQDGVAHFAHLGGMLFALILILYWKKHGQMYN